MVHLPDQAMDHVRVGDLLMILPVHSCLAVAALGEYVDPGGGEDRDDDLQVRR